MKFNKNEFGWKEKVDINTDELATKKYVDDKIILEPLPIYDTKESTNALLYIINIMDLDKRKTYGAVQHGIDKRTIYRFVYICDDGSQAMIASFGDGVNENPFRVWHYTNSSILYCGDYYYNIDYTNHATRTDVVVTERIQKYLNLYNTTEYTPEDDYNPATKKYVDDTKFSKNYEDLNNEPFTFVPIKLTETNESNGDITAYCDVFDLEQGYRYIADFTKYDYVCLYTFNNDNTKNTLVTTIAYLSTGRNGMITVMSSNETKRDILWMSAYGSEQIRIIKNSDETFTITNSLMVPRVTNTKEFTPTSNYNLVHKKYVDDAIANQPQISFDTEGNLVVTIGGVTKKFKEITK